MLGSAHLKERKRLILAHRGLLEALKDIRQGNMPPIISRLHTGLQLSYMAILKNDGKGMKGT